MKFRDLVALVEKDGWVHVRTTGSHYHYPHATKKGVVTIPTGGKLGRDVPQGTMKSVLRQAGIEGKD